ncbi:hypothetical protein ILUMI_08864 [Ignelater luminosus]|uniref:Uncharacterized protein n=1 Tax=Ignelater luminosus TaxID=2038154 RepID=A0A8K0GD05_IGNLU|nr:hypothetical protein ILUMI_08864 [Ignelater luminosus]
MSLTVTDVSQIVALIEDGHSRCYVSRSLEIPRTIVQDAWNWYLETGRFATRIGSGRKRATTAADDRFIVLNTLRNRSLTAVQIQHRLLIVRGVEIKISTIMHVQPDVKGSFQQLLYNNADFNVCTLGGLNTFHSIEDIKCIALASSVDKGTEIIRLSKIPTSAITGQLGVLSVQVFHKSSGCLRNRVVEDIGGDVEKMGSLKPQDILFMCAK